MFTEESEEQRADHVASLRSFGEFVRTSIPVLGVPEVFDLRPSRRDACFQLIGSDGVESVLAAVRPGHLLWTDDCAPAVFAREDFGSDRRAWTQVILHHAAEEGVVTREEFDRLSATLIGMGYEFTWLNSAVALQAGAMAGWDGRGWPLRQALQHLGRPTIEPGVRVGIAAELIVGMFRLVPSPFTREGFVRAVLSQLADRGFTRHLVARIRVLFGLNVIDAEAVAQMIDDWRDGPFLTL